MRSLRLSTACAVMVIVLFSQPRASNLANPAAPIPDARVGIGASYHLGGHTISNDSVPCLMNRFHARLSYGPVAFINFGVDLGTTQIEVAGDTNAAHAYPPFHGKYGFSAGGHLKLSTPFFFDEMFALMGIAQATLFSSENTFQARYGGIDGNGGVGVQFHIPGFGYLTAGSTVYLIEGKNSGPDGNEGYFSNINNVRGWLAIDYFPKIKGLSINRPYISFEISLSPEADINSRAPIRDMGFSVSIGSVTSRLYGEESGPGWEP